MSIRSPTACRTWRKGSSPLSELGGRDVEPARCEGVLVERPHLHAGHALGEEALGELARAPVEEGVEVLVGAVPPLGGRQAPVVDVGADRGPDVAVPRAGVVDADRLARLPAEELGDRAARRLAREVPERDVDGGVPARLHARAPGAHVLLEGEAEPVDRGRVLPEEPRRGGLVEIGGDLVRAEEGLPEADEARVRVEAHEADVGELGELDGLERRDTHRMMFLSGGGGGQPLMAPLVRPLTK